MIWSYGLTTVPERFHTTLPSTLESLAAGGFDAPRLFVDGATSVPKQFAKYPVTYRSPRIRLYGNWILGLWELYLRNPAADRYAMFQDDFVTYPNLRQYLESCPYPSRGYWNLYTFPQNEKKYNGWYLSNQLGMGALALVFDNQTVRALIGSSHMSERIADKSRGHKLVDGAVVTALKKQGWREYVHNPSLVQHMGLTSTIKNKYGSDATTFRGAEFDAAKLIEKPKPVAVHTSAPSGRKPKIGLVGYNCNTGLGELNRQIATYADIDKWLIRPHAKYPSNLPHEDVDCWVCPTGAKVEKFVKSVDVLLFCETPYYNQLIDMCRKHGKRMVCVPMQEWMPPAAKGWPQVVDLFICPTRYCYDLFSHVIPSVHLDWPIDTQRFQFQQREKVERYLYLHGHGGVQDRKGGSIVKELVKLWPEIPLLVRSQTPDKWPDGVEFSPEVKSNSEAYRAGDVLLVPHTVDGLGLEPLEAMSCGMPVIMTDGKPWNESPSLARIPSKHGRGRFRRPVDVFTPSAESLAAICRENLGRDIKGVSLEVRQWAERRSWDIKADTFNHLVRYGTPLSYSESTCDERSLESVSV